MKIALLLIAGLFLATNANAFNLEGVEVGDYLYIVNAFKANEKIEVLGVNMTKNEVRVRRRNGDVEWVYATDLLTYFEVLRGRALFAWGFVSQSVRNVFE